MAVLASEDKRETSGVLDENFEPDRTMKIGHESKLNGYAHLVAVLRSLEDDIGMGHLTPLERNIVAALSLDEYRCGARSEALLSHKLLDGPTISSFYRALKNLRSKNIVEVAGDGKTGSYRIVW